MKVRTFVVALIAPASLAAFEPLLSCRHESHALKEETPADGIVPTLLKYRTKAAAEAGRPHPSRLEPVCPSDDNLRKAGSAPRWAVGYGDEFWRLPAGSKAEKRSAPTAGVPGVSLADVVERVSHAWTASLGGFGSVHARTYQARVNQDGLSLLPLGSGPFAPKQTETAKFRTTCIRIGSQVYYCDAPREWSMTGNVAQALLSSGTEVVEHCEARSEGVELTWVLKHAPAVPGPLILEAELTGMSFAGSTRGGHHYCDRGGVARVRLGTAELRDAHGLRRALPVQVAGATLSIPVPDDALAAAAFPIAIDPVIGPEFGFDQPVLAPANLAQNFPCVAFNGTIYLVAWQRT